MHRELLLNAYKKVEDDLFRKHSIKPSLKACGDQLSLIISDTFPYSEKSFRNLYHLAKKGEEISIKQPKIVEALAQYLGYVDYKDFLKIIDIEEAINTREDDGEIKITSNTRNIVSDEKTSDGSIVSRRKRFIQIVITIFILGIICFFGYNYFNKQRWMEWSKNHYVETSFDSEKLNHGNLKVYKEERIEDFKKVDANCETAFFNMDGSVRIWYGKNTGGNLEYFTSYGQHPETGKTLKPITNYMIRKYICK